MEGDGHLNLEVFAVPGGGLAPEALRAAAAELVDPGAAAGAAAAAPSQATEEAAEDALGEAEIKHIVEISALENIFLGKFLPEDLGAELVVFFAFIGIAQDRVGLTDLLEFLFRDLLIPFGLVGMVLQGQLAVGLLDCVGRGVPADFQ